jgi:hypothetical protein
MSFLKQNISVNCHISIWDMHNIISSGGDALRAFISGMAK